MNTELFLTFYNFSHQSKFFDWLIYFFAQILPYFVALFIFIYFFKKRHFLSLWLYDLIFVFSSSFAAWFASHVLKNIFMMPRPPVALLGVESLWLESGYAFPSGHASFFMALSAAFFMLEKRTGMYIFLLSLLIVISRIIGGVHFPFDIAAGTLLGFCIAILFKFLFNLFINGKDKSTFLG